MQKFISFKSHINTEYIIYFVSSFFYLLRVNKIGSYLKKNSKLIVRIKCPQTVVLLIILLLLL